MSSQIVEKKRKAAALLVLLWAKQQLDDREPEKKKKWMASFIKKFGNQSLYETVYLEWRFHDPEKFRSMLRMDVACFEELLDLVRADIERVDTQMRNCIRPDKRLTITLRYLATGCNTSSNTCNFENNFF